MIDCRAGGELDVDLAVLVQGDVFYGEGKCKKHYLGLSDNVTYVVEQVEASETDTYRYKVVYRPEALVPDIEMQTSSSSQSGS